MKGTCKIIENLTIGNWYTQYSAGYWQLIDLKPKIATDNYTGEDISWKKGELIGYWAIMRKGFTPKMKKHVLVEFTDAASLKPVTDEINLKIQAGLNSDLAFLSRFNNSRDVSNMMVTNAWLSLTEEEKALLLTGLSLLPDRFTKNQLLSVTGIPDRCFTKPPSEYLLNLCSYPWELTGSFDQLFFKAELVIIMDSSLPDAKCVIPSKTLRDYLDLHPVELTIMQRATLVSEFVADRARKKKIALLCKLREAAENENEQKLLDAAISDLKKTGHIGEPSFAIYNELFRKKNDSLPYYPFLEKCDLPVLLKKGDIAGCAGKPSSFYYIVDPPFINEHSDFTDECYYCYDLDYAVNNEDDLFEAHHHLHVCRAELRTVNDLSERQRQNYYMIKAFTNAKKNRR